MAYRRRQDLGMDSTTAFNDKDEIGNPNPSPLPVLTRVRPDECSSSSSASSLAAKAIRASSAYRDSSLSSAYGHSSLSSPSNKLRSSSPSKDSTSYEYVSMKSVAEPKQGFWEVLARKAKGIIEDSDGAKQFDSPGRAGLPISETPPRGQYYQSPESRRKTDNPALQKGLDAITSSLNYLGGTIGNALEEGLTIVENRTADIIQETRKLQVKKKDRSSEVQNQTSNIFGAGQPPPMQKHVQPQMHKDLEIQLKASRDVAMAMAAKAKLLLRELKTVKADLAFAKERCGQLEEENRILRESSGKGDNPEDDDLDVMAIHAHQIRLQLETLLAEKARLAQENSVFARENRFLREIVEYHQLTMQDVVYLDESNEDVTEVYPLKAPTAINLQPSGAIATSLPSPTPPSVAHLTTVPHVSRDVSPHQMPSL